MQCPECGAEVLRGDKIEKTSDGNIVCEECSLTSAAFRWGVPERKTPNVTRPRKKGPKVKSSAGEDFVARIVGAALLWVGLILGAICFAGLVLHIVESAGDWSAGDEFRGMMFLAGGIQSLLLAGAGIIVDRVCKIAKRD